MSLSDLEDRLEELKDKDVLMILKPGQLNILGQVFRPILCAKIVKVSDKYIELKNVNIKMSNAPEFIFPTPLLIPMEKIAIVSPFDSDTRFALI
ncbi:hypothetical protein U472_07640 [Orenia metallireducens]|jgi:hypothetical protein|uniref:Uncharacterized protein n=1 Tax=Orenia metallireducens TaxID=1413210 RepID=A0A1C0AAK6_9FIRM|nr:hypothetical protein [Orenia metallireducens]OCL27324.1 hypothetical protein U472_07640 [Orenia metallireducens]